MTEMVGGFVAVGTLDSGDSSRSGIEPIGHGHITTCIELLVKVQAKQPILARACLGFCTIN